MSSAAHGKQLGLHQGSREDPGVADLQKPTFRSRPSGHVIREGARAPVTVADWAARRLDSQTAASLAVASGAMVKSVQRMPGHASAAMTPTSTPVCSTTT